MASRMRVCWEVLRRSLRRTLSAEWPLTLLGLAGPIAICAWTVFRPFDLRQGWHNLEQCAIWLAAWYTLFPILYALLRWSRPIQKAEGADVRHLPLSRAHFFLIRAGELTLVPLRCFALSIPLWAAVLLYTGLPYGQQWATKAWYWYPAPETTTLWPVRLGLCALVFLSATLLPLGLALVLSETMRSALWRSACLLGLPVALYFIVRQIEYTHFRLCYRQTRGYDALAFVLPLLAWLLAALLVGLLRPHWRVAVVCALLAGAGAFFSLPHLHRDALTWAAPARRAVNLHDARQALAYAAGHLSPTLSARLVLAENMSQSNVLFRTAEPVMEPSWSDYQDSDAYENAYNAWEEAVRRQPRLPLWVGAVLYPLLLPLLAFAGLLISELRRRDPPRETGA